MATALILLSGVFLFGLIPNTPLTQMHDDFSSVSDEKREMPGAHVHIKTYRNVFKA
jgi:hypothetical protein